MKSNTTTEGCSYDNNEMQSQQQSTNLRTKRFKTFAINDKISELEKKVDHLNHEMDKKLNEKDEYYMNLIEKKLLEFHEHSIKQEKTTVFCENHANRGRKRNLNALNVKNRQSVHRKELSSNTDEQGENIE